MKANKGCGKKKKKQKPMGTISEVKKSLRRTNTILKQVNGNISHEVRKQILNSEKTIGVFKSIESLMTNVRDLVVKSKQGRCGGTPVGSQSGLQDGTGQGNKKNKVVQKRKKIPIGGTTQRADGTYKRVADTGSKSDFVKVTDAPKKKTGESSPETKKEIVNDIKNAGSTDSAKRQYESQLDKMSLQELESDKGKKLREKFAILNGREYDMSGKKQSPSSGEGAESVAPKKAGGGGSADNITLHPEPKYSDEDAMSELEIFTDNDSL